MAGEILMNVSKNEKEGLVEGELNTKKKLARKCS